MTALSSYWLPDSRTPEDQRAGLVLGFAAVPEAQISEALRRCAGLGASAASECAEVGVERLRFEQ